MSRYSKSAGKLPEFLNFGFWVFQNSPGTRHSRLYQVPEFEVTSEVHGSNGPVICSYSLHYYQWRTHESSIILTPAL